MWLHQKGNPQNLLFLEDGGEHLEVYAAGIVPRFLVFGFFEEYTYNYSFQADDWVDCTFWHNGRVFVIYFTKNLFHLALSGTVLLQRPEAITIPNAIAFLKRDDRRKSTVERN